MTELVAEAEHTLLGAGLLLVAARPAERRVELVLPDGAKQGHGLDGVAPLAWLDHPSGVDVFLDRGDDQAHSVLLDQLVAGRDHLVEVVSGVDVHHRERQPAGTEGPQRQMQHDDGVLAAREQQHRPLELGGHLPNDVDRLCLQRTQVAQFVLSDGGGRLQITGHSFLRSLKPGRTDHIWHLSDI